MLDRKQLKARGRARDVKNVEGSKFSKMKRAEEGGEDYQKRDFWGREERHRAQEAFADSSTKAGENFGCALERNSLHQGPGKTAQKGSPYPGDFSRDLSRITQRCVHLYICHPQKGIRQKKKRSKPGKGSIRVKGKSLLGRRDR